MGFKLPPKQITRQNLERVAGAPDRRQFDNFDTTGVFTGGGGLAEVGEVLTGMAGDQLQQLEADARHFAQAEEVELKALLKEDQIELQKFSSEVNTRAKDQQVKYKTESQKYIDGKINAVDQEPGRSAFFKEKYKRQLQTQLQTHNAAVKKTVTDLTLSQHIDDINQEYNTVAIEHENDLPERLRKNTEIFQENMLTLGEKESKKLYKQANEDAALFSSNKFLALGKTTEARKALEDPTVRSVLGTAGRRTQIAKINKIEIQTAVNAEVFEKTKQADNFIDRGELGLFDISKNAIVPGSDDPTTRVLTTTAGAFRRNDETNEWELIPGTKPASELSPGDKAQSLATFLAQHGVAITEDRALALANILDEKQLSDLQFKFKEIDKLNLSPEEKGFLKQDLIQGAEVTDFDKQRSLIEGLGLSPEVQQRALTSLGTGGKDIRTATEKGEDAAVEEVAKAKKKDALGYREPVQVTSKETNSIAAIVKTAFSERTKDGQFALVPGSENLVAEVIANAEDLLLTGKATTIGGASFIALKEMQKSGRIPERITGLSQVENMIARANQTGVEPGATSLAEDAAGVDAGNAEALATLKETDLESIFENEGLDIRLATGVRSALENALGSTVAQIPFLGFLENKEVTKSRLMLSLIARDVVRLISLSPRFAVKEQELIQSMFSGPELFNSPRQAMNKINVMKEVIDRRMDGILRDLSRHPSEDKESELVDEASRLTEMKERMNLFTFDFIEVNSVEEAGKLNFEQTDRYWGSLSPKEQSEVPDDIVRELYKKLPSQRRKAKKPQNVNPRVKATKKKPAPKPKVKKRQSKKVGKLEDVGEMSVSQLNKKLKDPNISDLQKASIKGELEFR